MRKCIGNIRKQAVRLLKTQSYNILPPTLRPENVSTCMETLPSEPTAFVENTNLRYVTPYPLPPSAPQNVPACTVTLPSEQAASLLKTLSYNIFFPPSALQNLPAYMVTHSLTISYPLPSAPNNLHACTGILPSE